MKHLLSIIALFCAFSVSAQIAQDTTYFSKENGQWFKVRAIQYANQNRNMNYEFVGDSLALYNSNLNTTGQRVADMAVEVQSTANFTKELNRISITNTQVRTASGQNFLDTSYSQNKDWYLQGTWVMRGEDSGTFVFSETAAGQLRYSYNGGTDQERHAIRQTGRYSCWIPDNRENHNFLVQRQKLGAASRRKT